MTADASADATPIPTFLFDISLFFFPFSLSLSVVFFLSYIFFWRCRLAACCVCFIACSRRLLAHWCQNVEWIRHISRCCCCCSFCHVRYRCKRKAIDRAPRKRRMEHREKQVNKNTFVNNGINEWTGMDGRKLVRFEDLAEASVSKSRSSDIRTQSTIPNSIWQNSQLKWNVAHVMPTISSRPHHSHLIELFSYTATIATVCEVQNDAKGPLHNDLLNRCERNK